MLLPRQNGEAERSTCQAGFKGAQPGHTTGQMTADRGNSLPSLTSPVAHLTARQHERTAESKPSASYYVGLCPHVTPRGAAVCADQTHQSCNFQCNTSNSSVPLSSRSTGSKNIRPSENIINSPTNVKAFLLERPPLVIKWACAQKKKKKKGYTLALAADDLLQHSRNFKKKLSWTFAFAQETLQGVCPLQTLRSRSY